MLKESYRPNSLIILIQNSQQEIPTNKIHQCSRIINHKQERFIPRLQENFNIHKLVDIICLIDRMKGKKMIINKEKSFNIIQHPFVIKILNEIGLRRIFLNILKLIYENPTASLIIVKDEHFFYDHEQEYDGFFSCFYSTLHWKH